MKLVKTLGYINGWAITSNPFSPPGFFWKSYSGELIFFVSTNLIDDVKSFLKGDEVKNDALLEALEKLGNDHAPEPGGVMPDLSYDPDEEMDFDIEDGVFGGEDEGPVKKKKEKKKKTKTFKADKMANGFVFQSNPLAEGKEPFYMEAYLLGNNEIYISGGMAGLLNGDEAKQLRKQLKMLLNQLNESYPNPDTDKGGKTTLKVNAPWVPSGEQLNTIAEMVKKETKKVLEKVGTDLDENTLEFIQTIALHTAVTAISQLAYTPHTPTASKAYDLSEELATVEQVTASTYGETVELNDDGTIISAGTVINFPTPATTQEDDELLKAAEELGVILDSSENLKSLIKKGHKVTVKSVTPVAFTEAPKQNIKVKVADDGKATMAINGETLDENKKTKKK